MVRYRESGDTNKAVNWALRNIGKRSLSLNQQAIETAHKVQEIPPSRAAHWIAADALCEPTSEKIQQRLQKNKQEYHL
jgi:3-methyladenine DNA glycosylase AlkD